MISRIIKIAVIAVLAVAVIGTGYWGYQEHQDKNSVLIQAENNYQRAFHDLNNNLSNLEDELGKSLATNSRKTLGPCLANVWRIAYQAQSNIGQLPLNLSSFHQTEKFLSRIGDFTFDIGMRDLEGEPLSDEEWNQLQSLHSQSKEVQQEMRHLQTQVLDGELRWMDVEMASAAAEGEDVDKTLIDGMGALEEQVEGYIEAELDVEQNKNSKKQSNQEDQLDGKPVSEQEAVQNAREFFEIDEAEIEVNQNGEGRKFTSYSVELKPQGRNDIITVDVSQRGGHILQMLDSRNIEDTEISLHEAEQKARQFLENNDIDAQVAVESDQYDNVGVFDFVTEQDEVRIYPEVVHVKVALDNGDIIGYQGLDYVLNHQEDRDIPEPELTAEEAQADLNGHFTVMEEHLSMIEVEAGEEILCYEFLGTVEDETYRVFVNAQTGDEEKVEKMKRAHPVFFDD